MSRKGLTTPEPELSGLNWNLPVCKIPQSTLSSVPLFPIGSLIGKTDVEPTWCHGRVSANKKAMISFFAWDVELGSNATNQLVGNHDKALLPSWAFPSSSVFVGLSLTTANKYVTNGLPSVRKLEREDLSKFENPRSENECSDLIFDFF